ncbi:hypothetical protein RB6731 [Rhodopirellula baltica SH 1]|uniref:Uncharacterized protein n=1 Tax=Rhodopirellula baltica (strain DSM 10527 / NCIMB 13988 / SH1) TaxID=243090 RepID=Q7UPT5_RHOBA|nr:hypothetical protein RB6731 [Rhodopirellula baltica SH 1]
MLRFTTVVIGRLVVQRIALVRLIVGLCEEKECDCVRKPDSNLQYTIHDGSSKQRSQWGHPPQTQTSVERLTEARGKMNPLNRSISSNSSLRRIPLSLDNLHAKCNSSVSADPSWLHRGCCRVSWVLPARCIWPNGRAGGFTQHPIGQWGSRCRNLNLPTRQTRSRVTNRIGPVRRQRAGNSKTRITGSCRRTPGLPLSVDFAFAVPRELSCVR